MGIANAGPYYERYLKRVCETVGDKQSLESRLYGVYGELVSLGLETQVLPEVGVLGTLRGGRTTGGKTLALFTYLDEQNGEELAAVLAAAASHFYEQRRSLAGNLVFLFLARSCDTAGEELLSRKLEELGLSPDGSLGLCLSSGVTAGKCGLCHGPIGPGSFAFDVTLEGRGGHGSMPWEAISPIDGATAMIPALCGLPGKVASPGKMAVLTITELRAGTKGNIIPDHCSLSGSCHFLDIPGVGVPLRREVLRVIEETAAAYELTAQFHEMGEPTMPMENNRLCLSLAEKALVDYVELCEVQQSATQGLPGFFGDVPSVLLDIGCQPTSGTDRQDVLSCGYLAAIGYTAAYVERTGGLGIQDETRAAGMYAGSTR